MSERRRASNGAPPQPKGRPAATSVAGVIALAAVAFAVATVRDLAVSQGWSAGTPWCRSLLDALDGATASTAWGIAGIAVAALGVALVVTAVAPRPRTHDHASAPEHASAPNVELWVQPSAVAALATRAAQSTPGVFEASTAVRRRKVLVRVSGGDDVAERARERVCSALDQLSDRKVVVRAVRSS